MKNKALFLDRDGVINIEKNYVIKRTDFEFIPDIFDACKYFQELGFKLIIITNQSGIARGFYSEQELNELHKWVKSIFQSKNIEILDIYYCPHHPNYGEECKCRKPKPGLILDAIKKYDIDPRRSILIGDKVTDVLAGRNAKVGENLLVKTGHKFTQPEDESSFPEFESMSEIVRWHKSLAK